VTDGVGRFEVRICSDKVLENDPYCSYSGSDAGDLPRRRKAANTRIAKAKIQALPGGKQGIVESREKELPRRNETALQQSTTQQVGQPSTGQNSRFDLLDGLEIMKDNCTSLRRSPPNGGVISEARWNCYDSNHHATKKFSRHSSGGFSTRGQCSGEAHVRLR
jgi:hypothetical protein